MPLFDLLLDVVAAPTWLKYLKPLTTQVTRVPAHSAGKEHAGAPRKLKSFVFLAPCVVKDFSLFTDHTHW
jgi:hypothetical protein